MLSLSFYPSSIIVIMFVPVFVLYLDFNFIDNNNYNYSDNTEEFQKSSVVRQGGKISTVLLTFSWITSCTAPTTELLN